MDFDAEYMIGLAKDKTQASRNILSQIISDMFDDQQSILTDHDKNLMFGILHGLIRDVEISLRKNISIQLSIRSDAPTELILELANDDIEVAYPILTKSPVLRDKDLIEIIQSRAQEHQLAITLRHDISEDVSDVIIQQSDEDVITSLLKNENARVSASSFEYLVEQSKRFDTFQEPLLHRAELPEDLALKMLGWVSDALKDHIVSRYNIDVELLDELMHQTQEQSFQERRNINSNKLSMLASVLNEENLISPNMIMSALNDGEAHLFLSLFSQAISLDEAICSKILFNHSTEPLAFACKAAGLDYLQFGILLNKTRNKFHANQYEKENENHKALNLFKTISDENAHEKISSWNNGTVIGTSAQETV